jgi:transposase
LPDAIRGCAELIIGQIDDLQSRVKVIEKAILACHRASEVSLRLRTIPGIGVITATAIAATVADAKVFRSGRHFAAWIGLVPRQNGTGGKVHLGPISKKGDPYIRKLLVLGATAVTHLLKVFLELSLLRSPPRLFTAAARSGLRPAPESRSRGALPHLSRSFTASFSFLLSCCLCSTLIHRCTGVSEAK